MSALADPTGVEPGAAEAIEYGLEDELMEAVIHVGDGQVVAAEALEA